jgi:hypothetical protein
MGRLTGGGLLDEITLGGKPSIDGLPDSKIAGIVVAVVITPGLFVVPQPSFPFI